MREIDVPAELNRLLLTLDLNLCLGVRLAPRQCCGGVERVRYNGHPSYRNAIQVVTDVAGRDSNSRKIPCRLNLAPYS